MGRETIIIYTCDKCDKTINPDEKYVDASTYGVLLHMKCWNDENGTAVAKMLGLNEIRIMEKEEYVKRVY